MTSRAESSTAGGIKKPSAGFSRSAVDGFSVGRTPIDRTTRSHLPLTSTSAASASMAPPPPLGTPASSQSPLPPVSPWQGRRMINGQYMNEFRIFELKREHDRAGLTGTAAQTYRFTGSKANNSSFNSNSSVSSGPSAPSSFSEYTPSKPSASSGKMLAPPRPVSTPAGRALGTNLHVAPHTIAAPSASAMAAPNNGSLPSLRKRRNPWLGGGKLNEASKVVSAQIAAEKAEAERKMLNKPASTPTAARIPSRMSSSVSISRTSNRTPVAVRSSVQSIATPVPVISPVHSTPFQRTPNLSSTGRPSSSHSSVGEFLQKGILSLKQALQRNRADKKEDEMQRRRDAIRHQIEENDRAQRDEFFADAAREDLRAAAEPESGHNELNGNTSFITETTIPDDNVSFRSPPYQQTNSAAEFQVSSRPTGAILQGIPFIPALPVNTVQANNGRVQNPEPNGEEEVSSAPQRNEIISLDSDDEEDPVPMSRMEQTLDDQHASYDAQEETAGSMDEDEEMDGDDSEEKSDEEEYSEEASNFSFESKPLRGSSQADSIEISDDESDMDQETPRRPAELQASSSPILPATSAPISHQQPLDDYEEEETEKDESDEEDVEDPPPNMTGVDHSLESTVVIEQSGPNSFSILTPTERDTQSVEPMSGPSNEVTTGSPHAAVEDELVTELRAEYPLPDKAVQDQPVNEDKPEYESPSPTRDDKAQSEESPTALKIDGSASSTEVVSVNDDSDDDGEDEAEEAASVREDSSDEDSDGEDELGDITSYTIDGHVPFFFRVQDGQLYNSNDHNFGYLGPDNKTVVAHEDDMIIGYWDSQKFYEVSDGQNCRAMTNEERGLDDKELSSHDNQDENLSEATSEESDSEESDSDDSGSDDSGKISDLDSELEEVMTHISENERRSSIESARREQSRIDDNKWGPKIISTSEDEDHHLHDGSDSGSESVIYGEPISGDESDALSHDSLKEVILQSSDEDEDSADLSIADEEEQEEEEIDLGDAISSEENRVTDDAVHDDVPGKIINPVTPNRAPLLDNQQLSKNLRVAGDGKLYVNSPSPVRLTGRFAKSPSPVQQTADSEKDATSSSPVWSPMQKTSDQNQPIASSPVKEAWDSKRAPTSPSPPSSPAEGTGDSKPYANLPSAVQDSGENDVPEFPNSPSPVKEAWDGKRVPTSPSPASSPVKETGDSKQYANSPLRVQVNVLGDDAEEVDNIPSNRDLTEAFRQAGASSVETPKPVSGRLPIKSPYKSNWEDEVSYGDSSLIPKEFMSATDVTKHESGKDATKPVANESTLKPAQVPAQTIPSPYKFYDGQDEVSYGDSSMLPKVFETEKDNEGNGSDKEVTTPAASPRPREENKWGNMLPDDLLNNKKEKDEEELHVEFETDETVIILDGDYDENRQKSVQPPDSIDERSSIGRQFSVDRQSSIFEEEVVLDRSFAHEPEDESEIIDVWEGISDARILVPHEAEPGSDSQEEDVLEYGPEGAIPEESQSDDQEKVVLEDVPEGVTPEDGVSGEEAIEEEVNGKGSTETFVEEELSSNAAESDHESEPSVGAYADTDDEINGSAGLRLIPTASEATILYPEIPEIIGEQSHTEVDEVDAAATQLKDESARSQQESDRSDSDERKIIAQADEEGTSKLGDDEEAVEVEETGPSSNKKRKRHNPRRKRRSTKTTIDAAYVPDESESELSDVEEPRSKKNKTAREMKVSKELAQSQDELEERVTTPKPKKFKSPSSKRRRSQVDKTYKPSKEDEIESDHSMDESLFANPPDSLESQPKIEQHIQVEVEKPPRTRKARSSDTQPLEEETLSDKHISDDETLLPEHEELEKTIEDIHTAVAVRDNEAEEVITVKYADADPAEDTVTVPLVKELRDGKIVSSTPARPVQQPRTPQVIPPTPFVEPETTAKPTKRKRGQLGEDIHPDEPQTKSLRNRTVTVAGRSRSPSAEPGDAGLAAVPPTPAPPVRVTRHSARRQASKEPEDSKAKEVTPEASGPETKKPAPKKPAAKKPAPKKKAEPKKQGTKRAAKEMTLELEESEEETMPSPKAAPKKKAEPKKQGTKRAAKQMTPELEEPDEESVPSPKKRKTTKKATEKATESQPPNTLAPPARTTRAGAREALEPEASELLAPLRRGRSASKEPEPKVVVEKKTPARGARKSIRGRK